jgi:hypothetical protein
MENLKTCSDQQIADYAGNVSLLDYMIGPSTLGQIGDETSDQRMTRIDLAYTAHDAIALYLVDRIGPTELLNCLDACKRQVLHGILLRFEADLASSHD